MSDGSESLASTVCRARRAAVEGRVIKVKLAGEVQCYILEAVGDAMAATRAIRQLIQGGFDLTDADTVAMKCKYLDDEGDPCTLNKLTLAHWIQQHPNDPLKIQVSLATLKEAARHIEREASMQDATAPNDVDCDEGKSMGTVEEHLLGLVEAPWGPVCVGDAGSTGLFPHPHRVRVTEVCFCWTRFLGGGRWGHFFRNSRGVSWLTQKKCCSISLEKRGFREFNAVYASLGGTAQSPWP